MLKEFSWYAQAKYNCKISQALTKKFIGIMIMSETEKCYDLFSYWNF